MTRARDSRGRFASSGAAGGTLGRGGRLRDSRGRFVGESRSNSFLQVEIHVHDRYPANWKALVDAALLEGLRRAAEIVLDRFRAAILAQPYRTNIAAALRGEFSRQELADRILVLPGDFRVFIGVEDPLAAAALRLWTQGGIIVVTPRMRRFLAANGFPTMKATLVVPPTAMLLAVAQDSAPDIGEGFRKAIVTSIGRRA